MIGPPLAAAEGVIAALLDIKTGKINNKFILVAILLNLFSYHIDEPNIVPNIIYWILMAIILSKFKFSWGDIKYAFLYTLILDPRSYFLWIDLVLFGSLLTGSLFRKVSFPVVGLVSFFALQLLD